MRAPDGRQHSALCALPPLPRHPSPHRLPPPRRVPLLTPIRLPPSLTRDRLPLLSPSSSGSTFSSRVLPPPSSPSAPTAALVLAAPPPARPAPPPPLADPVATAGALVVGDRAAWVGGQQQGLYAAEAKMFLVRKYLDLVRPSRFSGLPGAAALLPVPMQAAAPSAAAAAAVAAVGGVQGRVHVYADGLSGEGDGRQVVLCSGRRGHVGGGTGGKMPCLNPLFQSHQVLSARHCWDAGSGTEIAVYCNALHAGAFLLSKPRTEELAQGAMEVADVACARCRASIGWKFCSLGGHGTDLRNLNQVGRFGIVLSSIHRGKEFLPAWRAASVWEDSEEDGDEEEEEDVDEEEEEGEENAGEVGEGGRGDVMEEGLAEGGSSATSSSGTSSASGGSSSSSSSSSSSGNGAGIGMRRGERSGRSVWSVRALSRICRYHPAE
ncbi:hypothetical protein CLOM_g16904 [Closterium sp. NIES-68]|nr:hypothetical protein CLOM_g16904 [Closterium sp. NIES-68]GJP81472.1 hypothetical protein CLOP_g11616 [Closterium sp. NIES-67]